MFVMSDMSKNSFENSSILLKRTNEIYSGYGFIRNEDSCNREMPMMSIDVVYEINGKC